jgi:hypothetical protein
MATNQGIVWDDDPKTAGITWDDEPKKRTSDSFIGDVFANLLPSAKRLAGGMVSAVSSPVQTASGLFDAAAGGVRNLMPDVVRRGIDAIDPNPAATQRATATADAIGAEYKNRYGGLSNIANTVRTDPIGFAADASTLLGLGGGVARGVNAVTNANRAALAGQTPHLGNLLMSKIPEIPTAPITAAANAIDPVRQAVNAAGATAKLGGNLAAYGVGAFGTHTGGQSLRTAAQAGARGGTAAAEFLDNMRGNVPMEDVVAKARSAVREIADQRQAQYLSSKAGWSAANTPLPFGQLDAAYTRLVDSFQYNGHWKIDAPEIKTIDKIGETLAEFRADPSMHNVVGFDVLKQRLQAIYPESPAHKQAQRAVTTMTNEVKGAIVANAPDYAQAMNDSWQSFALQHELERSLSIGNKAAADTALRKLQSVMRNNANTNYGNRLESIDKLKQGSGIDLMPPLAGQALNTWVPRGLLGNAGGLTTIGAGLGVSPWAFGLLPFQSPRLMGEAAYYAGKASKGAKLLSDPIADYGLYAGQAGLLGDR